MSLLSIINWILNILWKKIKILTKKNFNRISVLNFWLLAYLSDNIVRKNVIFFGVVTWSWIFMSSQVVTSWVVTPFEGITFWRKLASWLALGGGTRSVAFNESSMGKPVVWLGNSAFKVAAAEECSATVVKCYWKKETRILSTNKPRKKNNTHFIVICWKIHIRLWIPKAGNQRNIWSMPNLRSNFQTSSECEVKLLRAPMGTLSEAKSARRGRA